MKDSARQILAFDVGGSHISSGLFSPADGSLLSVCRVPMHGEASSDEILQSFAILKNRTLGVSAEPDGIAVAIPNPFDYERGISHMKHKCPRLYGTDLRSGLSRSLNCDPLSIHFLNDTVAFLTGELDQGAGRGVRRAVGITLGTGIGSAFAVDGNIVVNDCGVPPGGEIWNLPYQDGTVEDVISTLAIQRRYEQLAGYRMGVRDIVSLGLDHPHVRETFEHFGKELGKVLRYTCRGFRPDKIILGGRISRSASLFQHETEREVNELATQLCVSRLFEHAPLIGAGATWMRAHSQEC
jgi:glucokinase